MQSVPRKLALGLILAAGVAACGDDVTVQDPPVVTPVVRSVVVSPSSATIVAGATFQFGAAVDADAGLANTVTWSASGGTGVTVDQNGLATATATATGTASICATSTANTAIKGCAQLAVTPAAPPATVQIDAVTRDCDPINVAVFGGAAACGLNTPVVANNVVGQISVAAVLDRPNVPGTVNVVWQVMNGATVLRSYTQTLVAASGEGLAAQQTLNNRVTQPINTAEYSVTGGVATPFFTNGERTIRVCLSTVIDSCTGAGQTALAQRTFTFANPNGFHVIANITNAGTAIAAGGNNANGVPARGTSAGNFLSWVGGVGMTVTATPVNYTGVPLAATAGSYTVNFGSAACDLSGQGNRAKNPAAVANPFSADFTYTNGGAASATTLNAYEMNVLCAAAATGEVPGANMVDGNGNAFITLPLGGAFGATNTLNNLVTPVVPSLPRVSTFRVDNRGPGAATFAANMNGRQNNWFNDAVQLSVRQAVNVDGTVTNNPTDAGFNASAAGVASTTGVTLAARGGVCTSVATCAALATRTTTAGLAETASGTVVGLADQMIVQSIDPFGNLTNPGATLSFGVDRTIPSIVPTVTAYTGVAPSIAPPTGTEMFFNALNGITPAASTYAFTAIDVAPALPAIASGIRVLVPANLDGRIQGLELSLLSRTASANVAWCPATAQLQLLVVACADPATGVATTSGWIAGTQTFGWAPGTPIAIDPSLANTQGYYGYSARSVDQAGNRSADATPNPAVFDITPPVQTALNNVYAAGNSTTTSGTLTANAGATDNLDFGFAHFLSNYAGGLNPGLGGFPLAQPMSTTGAGKTSGQLFGFNFAGPSILANQFSRAYTSFNRSQMQVAANACPGFLAAGFVCGRAAATAWSTTGLVSSGFKTWDVALNPAAIALATAVPALSAVTFPGNHPLSTGFGGGNTFSIGSFTANPVGGAPPATPDVTINSTTSTTANGTLFPSAFVEVSAGAQAPFLGGVEFWYLDTDLGVWARACVAGTPTYSITNTTWEYHCDNGWIPRSQANAAGYMIPTTITRANNASFLVAIGRTQLGDALMSMPIGITITP